MRTVLVVVEQVLFQLDLELLDAVEQRVFNDVFVERAPEAREVAGDFADIVANPGQLATRQQEFFRHATIVQTAAVDADRPQTVIPIVAVDKQDGSGGLGYAGKKNPRGTAEAVKSRGGLLELGAS